MSIMFNNTIIHVLDLSMNMPLFSTDRLTLNDEVEAFITKHIVKLWDNIATCQATFEIGATFSPLFTQESLHENFQDISEQIAQKYYDYMVSYTTIPSGDLLITHLTMDTEEYLAILKLNYKEGFTHYIEQNELGLTAQIIKHRGLFPSGSKQVEEAFLIQLSTGKITLLDHSKSKYLSLLFECHTDLSVKETLKVVEAVAAEVIENHYENKIEALSELKNNISESITRTNTLPIQQVLERTFGSDETVYENCMDKIEELGLKEKTLDITDSKISNKFASQRLKTDTGIEIKLPTPLFKNADYIEIINEPDGTFSIVLKNISQIINK